MEDAISTSDTENVEENNVNGRPGDLVRSNSTLSKDFTHESDYTEKNVFSWIVHMIKLK